MTYLNIIQFWFEEISPKDWWTKSETFDQMLLERFSGIHLQASRGELFEWRSEPLGRLAEIIILDQFSRNMYRNLPQSFSSDTVALILTQIAIENGADKNMTPDQKGFLYMPMMHSESLMIHNYSKPFFAQEGCESYAKSSARHIEIIERFGRYPHRNTILGRLSTPEEIEFLKQPGSSF